MTKIKYLLVLFFILLFNNIQSQNVQSPSEFLGYELGSRFSRHHDVIDYYSYLASEAPNQIRIEKYGNTYENRPLYLAYISSEENIKNIESIRENNLKNIGIQDGEAKEANVAIVWLSYNVHGNEASSTEASMLTIYNLLKEKQDWLKNTVVIIDPCANPDGRDRYVNWYSETASMPYNTDQQATEHNEPWPSGRPNHYLFDLNRDWAWATQTETQSKLKVYNKWMPQVHVDFHEQGINSPYYFAPAAEPFHEIITDWQREFQTKIGKNNASYFDKEGWFYFTKEIFDLLYPSYGDTYPTYSGAIGMTYEQAGHGRSGLGILNDEGIVLTLKDRILHHTTTGLSTIETASNHAKALNSQFNAYFNHSDSEYKSFVMQGNEDKINSLKQLLDFHNIQYGYGTKGKVSGYSYSEASKGSLNITNNDLVVSTNQPKAKMVQALFEPRTTIPDSLTYDITAWSLPYAYGLNTIASKKLIDSQPKETLEVNNNVNDSAIGYIMNWNHFKDAKFLVSLLKQNIKVRFTEKPITTNSKSFGEGALIVTKGDNKNIADFDKILIETANTCKRNLTPIVSGFSESGPDLGSSHVKLIQAPKIALLTGNNTESLNFGAFWHFFEQDLNYPVTTINTSYFNTVDLNNYNILILPSGYYGDILNDEGLKKLQSWIGKGGKVIAVLDAIKAFANKEGFAIKTNIVEEDANEAKSASGSLTAYADREREPIKNFNPGSIFKTKVDNTHPIAFGYDNTYFSLKLGNNGYSLLEGNNYNVSYINTPEVVSGFTGSKTLKPLQNSLIIGEEKQGRGSLIYMVDDVLFRGFWNNGKLFMANAIFFANTNY